MCQSDSVHHYHFPSIQIKCFTLFVTHYPLVTSVAEKCPEAVINCHMSYIEDTESNGEICNTIQYIQSVVYGYDNNFEQIYVLQILCAANIMC